MKKTQRRTVVPAVVLSALALAGCTAVSTPADMVALRYNGGPVEAKTFAECVPVSSKIWTSLTDPGDDYFRYPASQRWYKSDSAAADKDGETITFVTDDGIEMAVTGTTYFTLNTDCNTLRAFHEQIGNRTGSYFTDDSTTPDGWNNMLDTTIGSALNTAVDRAGQKYTYTQLYNDTATKTQWESDVLELLPGLVDRQTNGDETYFSDYSITLQVPQPPQSVKDALVEKQAAVARADAAKAEADAQVKTAEAQKALEAAEAQKQQVWIDLLGVEGWIQKYAIENGQNPLQPGGTPLVSTP
jgi:hypothetical protein